MSEDVKDYSKPASQESLESTSEALKRNGFEIQIVSTLDDARQTVLEMIPKGVQVFTATSVTLDQSGLTEVLNGVDYVSLKDAITKVDDNSNKVQQMRRLGSVSEYTVGSVHAITEDGQVIIASASGSQLPNYVYGANKVIWVVGSQKVVKDLNEAFDRIERHTFPLENERAKKVYGVESVISKLLIYRSDPQNRVTIVLVREAVGY